MHGRCIDELQHRHQSCHAALLNDFLTLRNMNDCLPIKAQ